MPPERGLGDSLWIFHGPEVISRLINSGLCVSVDFYLIVHAVLYMLILHSFLRLDLIIQSQI